MYYLLCFLRGFVFGIECFAWARYMRDAFVSLSLTSSILPSFSVFASKYLYTSTCSRFSLFSCIFNYLLLSQMFITLILLVFTFMSILLYIFFHILRCLCNSFSFVDVNIVFFHVVDRYCFLFINLFMTSLSFVSILLSFILISQRDLVDCLFVHVSALYKIASGFRYRFLSSYVPDSFHDSCFA